MQGSLKQIQLPEILQFLSMGKGSGLLTLSRGGGDIILFVRAGKIINSSSLERQRRLGELLVQRGILRRSVLIQVLKLQRTVESDKRLGQILVERDIVNEQTIREVLRLQLEEEIWSLFGWEEGDFKFEAVEESKLGDAIVQIDIEPLILEGSRRGDEWKKIQKALPSDQIVLTVKNLLDDFKRDLKLSPAEWKVLSQINGTFTIRAVINRSGLGSFEVFHILHSFIKNGLVTVKAIKKPDDADVPASTPIAAEDAPTRKPSGGLLSSLMGSKKERDTEILQFVSPVGALAHFANQLASGFFAAKEYKAVPEDRRLIEKMWRDIMMTFPRSDLISAERNHLAASKLETYFESFEFAPATQDAYEDSMEALAQLIDLMYRVFAQRLGERVTSKIARELIDDIAPRIRLKYGAENFNLAERVQMVLKLAA